MFKLMGFSYGNMALGFASDFSNNIPEPTTLWNGPPSYFLADDVSSWIYVFLDNAPGPAGVSVYTNRRVNSTWSCDSFAAIQGGNGTVSNLMILQDANGRDNLNVTLPFAGGTDQTTFLTNPDVSCGAGCSIVNAFEASLTHPWFYRCNITVGVVMNATIYPQHDLGLSFRNMASAAIALQGYGLNSTGTARHNTKFGPPNQCMGNPRMAGATEWGL